MGQYRDKKLLQKIAVILKELRDETGLVQTDVYDETRVHIGRIETAKANLSISTLSLLCKFYKISMSDFFKKVENVK
ncbi:MAG: helix-turn-helix transcriptional regulator [Bacteroidota bacterium]